MIYRGRRRRLVLPLTMLCKEHGGIPRFNQMLCRALDEVAPDLDLCIDVLSWCDTAEDFARLDPGWRHTTLRACGSARGGCSIPGWFAWSGSARRS